MSTSAPPAPDAIPSFKVLAPLPRRALHAERFKALDSALIREVELRVPAGERETDRAEFEAEQIELAFLDHPAFLPILGSGLTGGRPYSIVPLRTGASLATLLADADFPLSQRCTTVRSLAGALAALHLNGLTIGSLDAGAIDLDRTQGLLWMVHHRGLGPLPALPSGVPVPGDLGPGAPRSPQADVFAWGWLAYRVLASGRDPWEAGRSTLVPLRERTRELGADLAHAVEASLSPEPGSRPESGVALHALLQRHARDVLVPAEIPLEHSGTIPAHRIRSVLGELEAAGRIPKPRPTRKPAQVPGEASRGPGPASGATPGTAVGLGFLGLAATIALWIVLIYARGAAGPVPRLGLPAGLPAPAARDQDPYLRLLIDAPEVRPRDFLRYWQILAALAKGGRLPAGAAVDPAELEALRERFEAEPDRTAAALARILGELRGRSLARPGP